jgi:signal transduction histidine kinase
LIFKICCGYVALILVFMGGATNNLYTIFGTYLVPSHSLFMALMCAYLLRLLIDDLRNLQLWAYLTFLVIPTGPAILLQLSHTGLIDITPLRLGLHQFTTLFHIVGMGVLMGFRLARMDRERISISLKAKETTTLVEEQRNLISMLSHEFRTPLAVIQRSAEMLMLRLRESNGDVQDRLQRIQLQAQKLARLVDIFLSKDGMDDQAFSLAREVVQLKPFMDEFVAHTSRDDAEILVTSNVPETLESYIDPTLIGLAITNLIETARRFAHGEPIQIKLHHQSQWLAEIAIPCSGPELDDEEIRLIGNALFRHDVETQSMRSALGLHISQRIVDAHGGSIKLRDHGMTGIELCLLLPCEESTVEKD